METQLLLSSFRPSVVPEGSTLQLSGFQKGLVESPSENPELRKAAQTRASLLLVEVWSRLQHILLINPSCTDYVLFNRLHFAYRDRTHALTYNLPPFALITFSTYHELAEYTNH